MHAVEKSKSDYTVVVSTHISEHVHPVFVAWVIRLKFRCCIYLGNTKCIAFFCPRIARFMGPTWGPPGPCRPQMGPCWPHEPCYLVHFSEMPWYTGPLILHSQYRGCWWPGDARSQVISSQCIVLVVSQYSGLSTKMVWYNMSVGFFNTDVAVWG